MVSIRRIPRVALIEAVAVIECKLEEIVDVGGDHDLVVGRAVDAYAQRGLQAKDGTLRSTSLYRTWVGDWSTGRVQGIRDSIKRGETNTCG